jgi:hypothetical protein
MEISLYSKYSIAAATVGIGMLIVGAMIFGDTLFKSPEIACTQESKICPDGREVGRSGPLCEFAPCLPVEIIATTSRDENVVVPTIPVPAGCTKETKICPDGSSVGRVEPSCNFASCPIPKPANIDKESGMITGVVTVGPTCPVERIPPDPNCADKPIATELSVMTKDMSQVLQTFTSKSDGTFSIHFPVGSYVIVQKEGSPVFPRCAQSEIFTVLARSTVSVSISCDTGIR